MEKIDVNGVKITQEAADFLVALSHFQKGFGPRPEDPPSHIVKELIDLGFIAIKGAN